MDVLSPVFTVYYAIIICGVYDVNLCNNMTPAENIGEGLFSTIPGLVWINNTRNRIRNLEYIHH